MPEMAAWTYDGARVGSEFYQYTRPKLKFRLAENFDRNSGFALVSAETEIESVSAEIFVLQK